MSQDRPRTYRSTAATPGSRRDAGTSSGAYSGRRHARKPPKPADVKRMRRRVLMGLYTLLAIECAAALLTSPVLAIRQVTVTGIDDLRAGEATAIVRKSTVLLGKNWLSGPFSGVATTLRAMPWVRAAHVTRQFPDRSCVHISLRQPVMIVQIGADRYEVDAESVPIRPADRTSPALPLVSLPPMLSVRYGVRIQELGMEAVVKILRQTRQDETLRIAKIEVDQSHNLCLNMQDGILIRIGQAESIDTQIAIIRRIYTRRPDIARTLAEIDLSCPSAPACRLRVSQPAPAGRPAIDRFD